VTLFNPDSWMDVFTIIASTLLVAIPSYFSVKAHRATQEVKTQVVNGHSSPLRADLDRALAALESLGHAVGALRRDLAEEEERRHRNVSELRDEVDWRFNELSRKLDH
jgi:hypothetical protein